MSCANEEEKVVRRLLIGREAAAVVENGRLCEYLPLNAASDDAAAETIILGKVDRVVKGMDAAFIQTGEERNGFLPLKEKSESFSALPMQAGQPVLVQVKREAHGQKGAFLSRDITLCGEYVLFMPMNRYIGVSAKIEDEDIRAVLKQFGAALAQERFGLVMRTAAAQAKDEDIAAEVERLEQCWQDIVRRAPTAHVPSVLYHGNDLTEELVRDYVPRGIQELVTCDRQTAERLKQNVPVTVIGTDPLDAAILKQRDEALGRFVWLKSGGSLVIDECEAMTVIDVNTGKYTGKRCHRDTALRIDLEACGEIARQLRLRSVGGIVIIDFIDLAGEEERTQVLQELQRCLKNDRNKTVVHGFTSLGLVEMTRRRYRITLREAMRQHKE